MRRTLKLDRKSDREPVARNLLLHDRRVIDRVRNIGIVEALLRACEVDGELFGEPVAKTSREEGLCTEGGAARQLEVFVTRVARGCKAAAYREISHPALGADPRMQHRVVHASEITVEVFEVSAVRTRTEPHLRPIHVLSIC